MAGSQLSSVQTLPSVQTTTLPDWQLWSLQTSAWVQTLPSSQGWLLAWWLQPFLASQASSVHKLLSSQLIAAPGTHWPPWHASPKVHALLSVQTAVLAAKTQPWPLSQLSSVQTLPSSQTTALPGTHAELLHKSPLVQALLSSQLRTLAVWVQPVLASQASLVHKLLSSQLIDAPGRHWPPWQASPWVQALLSLHAWVLFVKTQPLAGSQLSSVHRLPSSQTKALPGTHTELLHKSPVVQALPSSQAWTLARWLQPLAGSQASSVQMFLSSHAIGAPGWQVPPAQTSLSVQAFLSLQSAKLLV